MGKLNFQYVADRALQDIDRLLSEWLPGGKRQGPEYLATNPTRPDHKPGSFSININTGQWADFATGDKGGDLVSLVAYIENLSQRDACLALADFLSLSEGQYHAGAESPAQGATGANKRKETPTPARREPRKPATWEPVFPVPEAALADRPQKHPKLGAPSRTWQYNDREGRPLLWVMRFDTGRGKSRNKEYRPLCFGQDANGKTGWTWKQPPESRPLYGLEYLQNRTACPVLLCEGEKAADAARELFPDTVAMTWLSGSKAIGKADFSPLKGREVWYWPDADQAGRESITQLAKALKKAGVARFSLVDLSLFREYAPGEEAGAPVLVEPAEGAALWPEKADAADAGPLGWTAGHMALLQDKGLIKPCPLPGERKSASRDAGATGGDSEPQARFKSTAEGLFYFDMKTESFRPLGARLDVLARSRNQDGRSWGLLVSFDDFDGRRKEWNIPAALFATEGGAEVVRGLLDRGYKLLANREAKKRLLEYLGDYNTRERVRLVHKMGWHGDAFMLPDQVMGNPPEPLHYYSDAPPLCQMAQSGTVEQWRDNVAAHCQGNSLPTFAISAAFAAPLLDVLGSETCGFHFVGDSSLGKSTLLKVAASVYGHPEKYPRTWRATDNALEATAAAHSDCLLVLDEIGQIDPRIVGETVYMLGNGEGKARASETGGSRGAGHQWRLVFLSSGEKTLVDHMAEANKKPQAGMEMRLLTIPSNPHDSRETATRLGIYEDAGSFSGGADLSAHLLEQAGRYYGAPFLRFLEQITDPKGRETLIRWIATQRQSFKRQHLDNNASGQAHRGADKFALVAAAGEYATMAGITGWRTGWATQAATACFRAWLAVRGGAGNIEDRHALDHVRLMLTKYGESRFTRWESEDARIDEHAARTMERWGFRKTLDETDSYMGDTTEAVFYLTSTGFKDMCLGLDSRRVARLLKEHGALETDKEPGRLTKKTRLPGGGKQAVGCYVIHLSALLSDSETSEDTPPETTPPDFGEASGF